MSHENKWLSRKLRANKVNTKNKKANEVHCKKKIHKRNFLYI